MHQKFCFRIVAVAVLLTLTVPELQAGGLRERRAERRASAPARSQASTANSAANANPYNPTGRPMSRMRTNMINRQLQKDANVAARTGQTVNEVAEKRIRRLETLGAIVGGLGAGLSGAATALDYSAPAITTPRNSSTLPSNFSRQMEWNSFNRNYSTNPDHAPVR